MTPYVNLHTHYITNDSGISIINNRLGFDEHVITNSYFSIGVHPWDVHLSKSEDIFEKAMLHENCLAVGECGLDKLREPELELQKKVFISQLEIAVKYKKPVIIHCVKAFEEVIEACVSYHSKVPLIIHGFNKSQQLAEQLIRKGFYLSLNSEIFEKKDFDFNTIPIQKLFLETDDDSNLSIINVFEKASFFLKIPQNELKEKIYLNFTTLFLNTHGR